jgi:hypothetical protein
MIMMMIMIMMMMMMVMIMVDMSTTVRGMTIGPSPDFTWNPRLNELLNDPYNGQAGYRGVASVFVLPFDKLAPREDFEQFKWMMEAALMQDGLIGPEGGGHTPVMGQNGTPGHVEGGEGTPLLLLGTSCA